jgi:signal transduction histidine kinase
MTDAIQSLWDQMRADLLGDALPDLERACQSLLDGSLGPLTSPQTEDLQSVERSVEKLSRRLNGEPIDWSDYSEAAHALRGPLNSTLGFSRLILKGIDGPINQAQQKAVETIHAVSRRLLALFNLLLDALLLLGDDANLKMEAVRAGDVLREVATVGQVLAKNLDFVFEAHLQERIADTVIQCDAARFNQALSGLLAVAAKYMHGGRIELLASCEGEQLHIRLVNQACQLPEPLMIEIPVLLIDQPNASVPYDAQLRLGIAWHLLTRMNAQLTATRSGNACTFGITLPTR